MKLMTRRESALPAPRTDLESWLEHFFGDAFPALEHLPQTFRGGSMPAVNLSENEKEFAATFELPGVDEKDIEVQILGNRLVVSGERKWEQEKKEKDFYRVETQFGAFRRVVPLPEGLASDSDSVSATFNKGMLEIHIPKTEQRPASKIKIRSK